LDRLDRLAKFADVYLVDDASSDGTALAVQKSFPMVKIIHGSGNLFWNRGMHLAWNCAKNDDYSHYIWLNDDVVLYEQAFSELMACSELNEHLAIISGIIESHDTKNVLYGGTDNTRRLIRPNQEMQAITNMNGNVVLIPTAVFVKLGNLDPFYHHDLGDVDYGLRAQAHGIQVFTTRIAVGSCEKNNVCRVRWWNANIWKRFRKLYSPLGNHPVINFYFRRRHYGLKNAIMYLIFIHLLNVAPDWLVKFIFGDKYIPN
jgi:GT2 family glycosyltransferase